MGNKNANFVSHKKSKQKVDGKPQLPLASALVEGEIAINFAKDVETLSIKNESGDVVTFSSDNYYTEQKLGSGFTGENSAVTVTDVIKEVELVTSSALNDLEERKLDSSAYTPTDLTNYYTKSETSGATEISTALADKADTATTYTKTEVDARDLWVSGTGTSSVAQKGGDNVASGNYSIAEGKSTSATSFTSHAEGSTSLASGGSSHAEGEGTSATSYGSHSEGGRTIAVGSYAHAEGESTIASGDCSHAEGKMTSAMTICAHAEGTNTIASGQSSHAEGITTSATTNYSHAEGAYTLASGTSSHAEGYETKAFGQYSHAEGQGTKASGYYSHAEGANTIANNTAEHASGRYNVSSSASTDFGDSGNTLFSVGNGTADNARHNAFEIRQNGDIYIVSGNSDIKLQDYIGGGSITVDQVLDNTTSASTNPVSSKAVHDAVTDNELVWTNAFVTLSGITSAHTANTEIHVTAADKEKLHAHSNKTALDSITGNVGTMAYQNTNSYSSATEVNTALGGKANTSDLVSYADSVKYNSTSRYVEFYHGTTAGTKVFEYDASPFIIDGMVDDVRIENGNLVIDFNTASGKQDISIPLTDIFDPSNYYDKDDIDDLVGSGFTSSSITDVIIENEEIVSAALTDLDERKLDATAYTPTDLSNYYTKSEIDVRDLWVSGTGENAIVQKGGNNTASGKLSVAMGSGTTASGDYSVAEGLNTSASGNYSHAEGRSTKASGNYGSHAEGDNTTASGDSSHAEGYNTIASGYTSHAEGNYTKAAGNYSHAEGNYTSATTYQAHAEGNNTVASGESSHAEGDSTTAGGSYSHAEGNYTKAVGNRSHAEGYNTTASGNTSHAEGYYTSATSNSSHAEGYITIASGDYSHAEGYSTTASGDTSHAEGNYTKAVGNYSHAEGQNTVASGESSHAEGNYTTAVGNRSHAEGNYTSATSNSSHAEGYNTIASGQSSHAEGNNTKANGYASHAEGNNTKANGYASHAEGDDTITLNYSEHASGQYNDSVSASTTFGDSGNTLFSVGNGTYNARHNAFEIRQNGDIYITSGNSDIKLQDYIGSVETVTAITPSNSGSTAPIATKVVAENELVMANALNDLDDRKLDASAYTSTNAVTSGSTDVITSGGVYAQMDGLKLKKITQSAYDQLQTKDPNTLYIISD